jgi:hypothetical protein
MKADAIVRAVLMSLALCLTLLVGGLSAFAQDVGGDVGGSAGIFRPRNPETRNKPGTPVTKSSTRSAPRKGKPAAPTVEDRIEDLLDKGNQYRDARRMPEAEEAYLSVLRIRPHDARAAYGLGNVYTDQCCVF